jgi:hypothetical protein
MTGMAVFCWRPDAQRDMGKAAGHSINMPPALTKRSRLLRDRPPGEHDLIGLLKHNVQMMIVERTYRVCGSRQRTHVCSSEGEQVSDDDPAPLMALGKPAQLANGGIVLFPVSR